MLYQNHLIILLHFYLHLFYSYYFHAILVLWLLQDIATPDSDSWIDFVCADPGSASDTGPDAGSTRSRFGTGPGAGHPHRHRHDCTGGATEAPSAAGCYSSSLPSNPDPAATQPSPAAEHRRRLRVSSAAGCCHPTAPAGQRKHPHWGRHALQNPRQTQRWQLKSDWRRRYLGTK